MESLRLRTTANTRSSISTRTTSAFASVRSTTLCARFETPSTYSGQRTDCEEHLLARCLDRLDAPHQLVQEVTLGTLQRGVQVGRDEILSRAVTQAPGESVDVALRRGLVRERARVLVDPECERRRLEGRRAKLPLGEDADERRRQRPVRRAHRCLGLNPRRQWSLVVMVEEDLLDARVERDGLELAQSRGVRRFDDHEALDRVELQAARRRPCPRARPRGGDRSRGRSDSASRWRRRRPDTGGARRASPRRRRSRCFHA